VQLAQVAIRAVVDLVVELREPDLPLEADLRAACSRRASLGRFISTMHTPGQKRSMKPSAVRSSNRAPSARRSVP